MPTEPPQAVRQRIRTGVVPIDQIPGNEPYQEMLGSGRIDIPAALNGLAATPDWSGSSDVRILVMPNPSTGGVRIAVSSESGAHGVRVFDAAGRLVRALPRSETLFWDGMTSDSRRATPGVYFIRAIGRDREYVTRLNIIH
jgi:hypothetical protein